jgi:GNAT superfamily N-acetyltransferase
VPTYFEPARSYRILWWPAGALVALFALDLAFGHGVEHLPGWLLAAALLLGVGAFLIHAVRVSRSLTLTEDELRVGDEVIARSDVVGVLPGVDAEAPVLGWPMGLPEKIGAVTVRLSDGRNAVVPSRFPERFTRALGLDRAEQYEIRAADPDDYAEIVEIDIRADAVFRVAGYDLPDIRFDEDDLADAAAIFVAGRPAVGYIWLDEKDGLAYVEQLAVVPKVMKQGLGGALLERAYAWARERGYPAMLLTTYADVPWNAPYYAKRGWVEISDLGPDLKAQRDKEIRLGLDGTGRRVVMRREL